MCYKCGVDKPRTSENYHWRNYRKQTLRYICKPCANNLSNRSKTRGVLCEIRQRVIIIPNTSIKDSEYHKNIESLDTNPVFFNHLCSGKDYFN